MPPKDIPLPAQPRAEAGVHPPTKIILVVDDEQPILELLYDTLDDAGYMILTAPNGQAALAIVQQQIPDLVLTDLMMPVMDGQTLCTRLRTDPRTANLPIILMTAARQPHIEAPFTEIVTKPFSLSTVLDTIEKYM